MKLNAEQILLPSVYLETTIQQGVREKVLLLHRGGESMLADFQLRTFCR